MTTDTPVTGTDAPTLRSRLVRHDELTDADVGRWRALARDAVEPNPFFEPETVRSAASRLGVRVGLLVVEDGTRMLGCLPVRRVPRWRGLPLPGLAAWTHKYCFLGTPLVHADHVPETVDALVRAGSTVPGAAYLALDRCGTDGAVGAALTGAPARTGLSRTVYERYDRAALVRRPEDTYLREVSSGGRRKEYRRQRRVLDREFDEPAVTVDRSADPTAPDAFLRLEAQGWKGRRGTAMASHEADAGYFRDLCAAFAATGRLQLLSLQAGPEVLAMKCNVVAGGTVFCFKIAHREDLARHSPGVHLELDTIGVFHSGTDAARMDSCAAPGNGMINRIWPDRTGLEAMLFSRPGPSTHLVRGLAPAGASLERSARRLKRKLIERTGR